MTKTEFQSRFTAIYKDFVSQNIELITNRLKQRSDENGNISNEELAAMIFVESLNINRDFLQFVLENVLEFDE